MRSALLRAVGAVVGCSLLACIRTEWRPMSGADCPPTPPPVAAFAAESFSSLPGTILGRVVDQQSAQPVPDARVQLEQHGVTREVSSRDDGAFRLDGVSAGALRIRTARVGFAIREDSLVLAPDAGLVVHVPLRFLPLDGCPGFAAKRVRTLHWPRW